MLINWQKKRSAASIANSSGRSTGPSSACLRKSGFSWGSVRNPDLLWRLLLGPSGQFSVAKQRWLRQRGRARERRRGERTSTMQRCALGCNGASRPYIFHAPPLLQQQQPPLALPQHPFPCMAGGAMAAARPPLLLLVNLATMCVLSCALQVVEHVEQETHQQRRGPAVESLQDHELFFVDKVCLPWLC